MSAFRRVRPTRTTIAALVGLLWALSFGALRDVVWADLRSGMVDLRGLPRATRGLVWLGFLLLFAMAGALLFSDSWRAQFELLPLYAGAPGRGELIPWALVPATLLMLTLAWSLALTGVLHSQRLLRLGILLLYLFVATGWTGMGALGARGLLEQGLGWSALAAVPIFFAARWRKEGRPVAEFAVLQFLVGSAFALSQARALELWRISGVPLVLGALSTNVFAYAGLAIPFLLFIGMDIADFVLHAATWTTYIVSTRLHRSAAYLLLPLVLAWRLRDVMREAVGRVSSSSFGAVAASYAGALGVPLPVGLLWWFVARWRRKIAGLPPTVEDVGEAGRATAPWLIVAFQGYHVVILVALVLLAALGAVASHFTDQLPLAQVQMLANQVTTQEAYRLLIQILALAAAIRLQRQGRQAAALYLGTFAAMQLWFELTSAGRTLAPLAWRGVEPVDFWWVVMSAVVGGNWLLRRRLTPARATRLPLIVLMTALLRQTELIENPLSPLFSFAGIGFVAFGIVWDALSVGSWANTSSPALPRPGRIFLYLGYVLFTATIVNWALTTHNLSYVESFTGETAIGGLSLFGKPMLCAIFAVTLAAPATGGAGPLGENRGSPLTP